MVKLVASDMDGTLLNSSGEISEETVNTIQKFQKNGGIFLISTGRDYGTCIDPIKKAGVECNLICSSGAAIHEYDGKILQEITIDRETCEAVVNIMASHGAYVEYFTNQGRMTILNKAEAEKYFFGEWMDTQVKGKILADYEKARNIGQLLLDLTQYNMSVGNIFDSGLKVFKICTALMDVEKLKQIKAECKGLQNVVVEASFPYNAEITMIGAQKGPAVAHFAAMHGILPEEIMVLGDSDNDKSMMEMDFGYTIAMANATNEIKSLAKYMTRTNDEDGVAHAIKTYILK